MNPAHEIEFPDTPHPHVVDVLKVSYNLSVFNIMFQIYWCMAVLILGCFHCVCIFNCLWVKFIVTGIWLFHKIFFCAFYRNALIAIHETDQRSMTCWSIHTLLEAVYDRLFMCYTLKQFIVTLLELYRVYRGTCSSDYLPVSQISISLNFSLNFVKCWPIFKILSALHLLRNLQYAGH